MARIIGDSTLGPGQSAGFFFDIASLIFPEPNLVLISVIPTTASGDDIGQWTIPQNSGWPLENQLGVSSSWVNRKSQTFGNNVRYYIVVTNRSNSVMSFFFLEAAL